MHDFQVPMLCESIFSQLINTLRASFPAVAEGTRPECRIHVPLHQRGNVAGFSAQRPFAQFLTLMFGGPSTLVCPTRTLCSSYQCPSFFSPNPAAANTICKGTECPIVNAALCCINTQDAVCVEQQNLLSRACNALYSNIGGAGPDYDSPEAPNLFCRHPQKVSLSLSGALIFGMPST